MNHSQAEAPDFLPWYRQGWPWFVISFPAISVVLGINMLLLAHQTNNSLVVDDYYKQGKTLHQTVARDSLAASLQLSALITRNDHILQLHLTKGNPLVAAAFPDDLKLQWIHVTQSHKDDEVMLEHIGGGWYQNTSAVMPEQGVWRLHISPADPLAETQSVTDSLQWRLVSDRVSLKDKASLRINYRS